MRDYDRFRSSWLPYLMFFHPRNFQSESVNTDGSGFRFNVVNERLVSAAEFPAERPAFLVGGSTAFGVGATSDARTLSSLLSVKSRYQWLNLGGRAFSGMQEFLLALTYKSVLPKPQRILIFSGVNDLFLSVFGHSPRPFAPFFFGSEFEKRMNGIYGLSAKRKLVKAVVGMVSDPSVDFSSVSIRDLMIAPFSSKAVLPRVPAVTPTENARLEETLESNFANWALLARAWNAKLTFVLQPLAHWINRVSSAEELALFSLLDAANRRQNYAEHLNDSKHKWYGARLEQACKQYGFDYFDMNAALESRNTDEKWLFVDRVHMTDLGYSLVHEILLEAGMTE